MCCISWCLSDKLLEYFHSPIIIFDYINVITRFEGFVLIIPSASIEAFMSVKLHRACNKLCWTWNVFGKEFLAVNKSWARKASNLEIVIKFASTLRSHAMQLLFPHSLFAMQTFFVGRKKLFHLIAWTWCLSFKLKCTNIYLAISISLRKRGLS